MALARVFSRKRLAWLMKFRPFRFHSWALVLLIALMGLTAEMRSAPEFMYSNIEEDGELVLSAYFSGGGPYTFSWRRDGAYVATATSDTSGKTEFKVPYDQQFTPATFIAEATVAGVTVASTPFTVSRAPEAPLIVAQTTGFRLNSHLPEGVSYTLYVGVTGVGPFTYRWRRDGNVVREYQTGITHDSMDTSALQAGSYTVEIVSPAGVSTSAPMKVTAGGSDESFYIIASPMSYRLSYGIRYGIECAYYAASGPVTFQWRRDGISIPGGTASSYLFDHFNADDAGRYSVVVTNGTKSITSEEATMALWGRNSSGPGIKVQPKDQSLRTGDSATLGVVADRVDGCTYQWYKENVAVAGATRTGLFLANVTAADAGRYSVDVISGGTSLRSATADVSVSLGTPKGLAPIALAPLSRQSVGAAVDTTVTLTATVTGTPAPTFQWQRSGNSIPGATTSTLSITAQSATTGTYDLRATNASGSLLVPVASVWLSSTDRPPAITAEPEPTWSVALGGSISFSYSAAGSPAPNFQWLKDGVPIDIGAASDTHYKVSIQDGTSTLIVGYSSYAGEPGLVSADAAGIYSVMVSNTVGKASSRGTAVQVRPVDVQGIYFAKDEQRVNTGSALYIRSDRSAVFLTTGRRLQDLAAGVATSKLKDDGTFAGNYSSNATGAAGVVQGKFFRDAFVIADKYTPITLYRASTYGEAAPLAGYWTATLNKGVPGMVHAIVSAGGHTMLTITYGSSGKVLSTYGELNAAGVLPMPVSYIYPKFEVHFGPEGIFAGSITDPAGTSLEFSGTRSSEGPASWLADVSSRAHVGTGDDTLQAGFVLVGGPDRRVLVRAVGSTLANFGVQGSIADPAVSLLRGQTVLLRNDDWISTAELLDATNRSGAFSLPAGSKDAVILTQVSPGGHGAYVSAQDGSTGGVALVEVYDAGSSADRGTGSRLVNISTRARVGTDDEVLIAGVAIGGDQPKRVLIRGVGPTLKQYGVTNPLLDPKVRLYKGSVVYAENDDWVSSEELLVATKNAGAFDLAGGSRDAAILMTLAPGTYTVQVRGANGTTGVALAEIYEVPNSL